MTVFRCSYCRSRGERVYVQWLLCRDGKRRLFLADLTEVGQLQPDQVGWVAGRTVVNGRERVAMAPITQVSRGKAEAANRVAVLHWCTAYQELRAAAFGDDGRPSTPAYTSLAPQTGE